MAATTHAVKSLDDLQQVLKAESKIKVAGMSFLSWLLIICLSRSCSRDTGVDGKSLRSNSTNTSVNSETAQSGWRAQGQIHG